MIRQTMDGTDFSGDAAMAREKSRLAREFWPKFKRFAARLPFAEDLVAAYFCAFDRNTPRHVQGVLVGALAYFVLPFDASFPTCCRWSASPTTPPCWRPRSGWSPHTSRRNIAKLPGAYCRGRPASRAAEDGPRTTEDRRRRRGLRHGAFSLPLCRTIS
jgi:hypothetical protein